MKSFAFLALAAVASAETMTSSDYEFMRYVVVHGKHYKNLNEFSFRKNMFLGKSFALD
jgi:hypothetical protein